MAEYVHPDVEPIRQNPSADAMAHLVIVPKDGQIKSVISTIQHVGGEVDERIPLDMLKVHVPENSLDNLASNNNIQAIHFDEEMKVLAQGNG